LLRLPSALAPLDETLPRPRPVLPASDGVFVWGAAIDLTTVILSAGAGCATESTIGNRGLGRVSSSAPRKQSFRLCGVVFLPSLVAASFVTIPYRYRPPPLSQSRTRTELACLAKPRARNCQHRTTDGPLRPQLAASFIGALLYPLGLQAVTAEYRRSEVLPGPISG